jgi:2-amino-4-hydroxy-6-hydroxymethyldihydropteridine diphosphokinase
VILIGIGGNLDSPRFGSPRDTLSAALDSLGAKGVGVRKRSSWYRSEPVPPSAQPWFLNAVASVATELGAHDLLEVLQAIETKFGRVRMEPNAARVIDLDLLDYRGEVTETPCLILPHPRLHQRRFVLIPLAEIAADWRHPLLGLTARQLLARITDEQRVEPFPPKQCGPIGLCPHTEADITRSP